MINPSAMPSVAIPRSRFLQDFTHSTTFNHGDLFPLDCFEVIAGDDFTVKKAAGEVHMSTPIAPIMGNIKMKVCAFFVPMRLVWEHTEEFFGANKTSAGPQLTTYTIPRRNIFSTGIFYNSVSHYLGKPICSYDTTKNADASVLKERCFWLIWSEWYRMQQVQNPVLLNKGDGGNIGTRDGITLYHSSLCPKVCKQYDIFTGASSMPQYGAAVTLPLGSYAPVITADVNNFAGMGTIEPLKWALTTGNLSKSNGQVVLYGDGTNDSITKVNPDTNDYSTKAVHVPANLIADLSQATAAKINDIRYAFQMQKYLERACYGSRFFEVLAVHYGVTSPDSRLQRPEYLGGKTAPIVIRTVLSTADYASGVGTKVGKTGAASITYIDLSGLFSKGFVEPGYVLILGSTSHERLYSQGLLREDTKSDRFEFYSPEFANLGDQEIKNKEIMVTGDATDEQTFAYTGHWNEYRYRLNRASGLLDPNAPGSLDYWTLAEKFSTRPIFSASFVEENRDDITRCLVTGSTGPDYIGDFFFQYQATRELPLYNIPGLVDHFGAL